MTAAFDIKVDAPSMALSGFGDQFFDNTGDFIVGDSSGIPEMVIGVMIAGAVLIAVAGISRRSG